MSSSLAPLVMLAMPFIEIAGFVIIGSKIGVFATLGLVILSAMLGFFLLRVQGIGLLQRIRTETAAGRVPDREMVHGAMLVLAAILLIVPGFVSSTIGILLFIPFIRDFMWEKFMRGRMVVATSARYSDGYGQQRPGSNPRQDHVIDLDPEDYTTRPNENSPWKDDRKDQ
ncbi:MULTISPECIES: FxsA family protein [Brucella/Ochrobactrum group]|uniref:FxsA cytoplasmic membrane protein n=3 Tax=Brucella TaxID=234 RepID=A6WX65_BRUA4|nr:MULTISPECIES: FxsA family protein [Brucella/Ochrobactrum group]MCQ9144152.1 membrane protein FxsA [Ochrobactrum sp. BTU2]MCR5939966.1 membrane protein FxsA [Ochrobactrum sp. XJ1]QOD63437.1 membrane protein FxsA [Ochrobactrum sp. MT180101]QTN03842.1 membrane protein FxsA [Ochrobactrum sp. EEELCW01]RNL45490.1 membrane protein FxsA [Ochrobactrum sp. MH181795]